MDFVTKRQIDVGEVTLCAAQFDPSAPIQPVQPPCRNNYINSASHPLVRAQRYYVWLLLQEALEARCGTSAMIASAAREPSGRWVLEGGSPCFSLSHSGNVVAVAVSACPVGLDVQSVAVFEDKNVDALAERTLSQDERREYAALPPNDRAQFALKKWCAKEALFKLNGSGAFTPAKQVGNARITALDVRFGDDLFALAVATNLF